MAEELFLLVDWDEQSVNFLTKKQTEDHIEHAMECFGYEDDDEAASGDTCVRIFKLNGKAKPTEYDVYRQRSIKWEWKACT